MFAAVALPAISTSTSSIVAAPCATEVATESAAIAPSSATVAAAFPCAGAAATATT